MITVYIDDDPASLGPTATEADMALYTTRLEDHLERKFGETFRIKANGAPVAWAAGPEGQKDLIVQVERYVREIEEDGKWAAILAEGG